MNLLHMMEDLEMIDVAKAELAKVENQENPLRDILEVMTNIVERNMGPKPKTPVKPLTWGEIWDRFDIFSKKKLGDKLEKKMTTKIVSENELIAKATGPRVTKEELDANVAGYAVFNVYDALTALGVPALEATKLLTVAVVTTKNGFTVVGESACAWPANYDKDIGERLALENAKNKLWSLMGYHLKEQLFTNTHSSQIFQSEAPSGESDGPKEQAERSEPATMWEDRVRQECAELSDRLSKLDLFIADDFKFLSLPDRQQKLLMEQRKAMREYLTILEVRTQG